jgi:hypothetical protein
LKSIHLISTKVPEPQAPVDDVSRACVYLLLPVLLAFPSCASSAASCRPSLIPGLERANSSTVLLQSERRVAKVERLALRDEIYVGFDPEIDRAIQSRFGLTEAPRVLHSTDGGWIAVFRRADRLFSAFVDRTYRVVSESDLGPGETPLLATRDIGQAVVFVRGGAVWFTELNAVGRPRAAPVQVPETSNLDSLEGIGWVEGAWWVVVASGSTPPNDISNGNGSRYFVISAISPDGDGIFQELASLAYESDVAARVRERGERRDLSQVQIGALRLWLYPDSDLGCSPRAIGREEAGEEWGDLQSMPIVVGRDLVVATRAIEGGQNEGEDVLADVDEEISGLASAPSQETPPWSIVRLSSRGGNAWRYNLPSGVEVFQSTLSLRNCEITFLARASDGVWRYELDGDTGVERGRTALDVTAHGTSPQICAAYDGEEMYLGVIEPMSPHVSPQGDLRIYRFRQGGHGETLEAPQGLWTSCGLAATSTALIVAAMREERMHEWLPLALKSLHVFVLQEDGTMQHSSRVFLDDSSVPADSQGVPYLVEHVLESPRDGTQYSPVYDMRIVATVQGAIVVFSEFILNGWRFYAWSFGEDGRETGSPAYISSAIDVTDYDLVEHQAGVYLMWIGEHEVGETMLCIDGPSRYRPLWDAALNR